MRLTDALMNNIVVRYSRCGGEKFRSRPSKSENSRERPTRPDRLATKCHLVAFLESCRRPLLLLQ